MVTLFLLADVCMAEKRGGPYVEKKKKGLISEINHRIKKKKKVRILTIFSES